MTFFVKKKGNKSCFGVKCFRKKDIFFAKLLSLIGVFGDQQTGGQLTFVFPLKCWFYLL